MRIRPVIALLSLALLVLLSGPRASAEESVEGEIRISFEFLRTESGRSLLALRADGVPEPGLAGFQVTLRWDPEQISIHDPNAALVPSGVPAFAPLGDSPLCVLAGRGPGCSDPPWLLTATGRWTLGRVDHDSASGRLTLAYGSGGDPAPAKGSGALALLEVKADPPEPLRIEIEDALLLDASSPPRRFPWRARSLGIAGEGVQ